jgi:hypothetical protein
MQLVKENENYIGNDNIIELIKKEVAIADKLKNIINEISIEYRSTGEIIIRLYRPKEDNKKNGDMINDIVDPLVKEEEKPKFKPEMIYDRKFYKISE